jgi:hypothetical protein
MFNTKQNKLLLEAVEALELADALIQQALGACDVCEDTHNRIQDIVEDLLCDIQENNPEDMDA